MRNPNSPSVAEGVYTLFHLGVMGTWTDERLVAHYLSDQEGKEAAFRVLLRRHGPMVLGVCRRTLGGDSHLAEDAFQATFLVLVNKAWTIRDRDLLANWLYGVAQRIAAKAKAQAIRRRVVERHAAEHAAGTSDSSDRAELRSVVDEEIRRLPERYRAPLVLCYLEGLTHHEAASRLGCPVGTIESRLSRARERLRSGLVRRGVAPVSATLAAVFAPAVASAAPADLIEATLRAAMQFASSRAGAGAVSTAALVLAEQRLRQGFGLASGVKLKLGTLIACVGVLTAGLGAYQVGGSPARPHDVRPERPAIAAEPPTGKADFPTALPPSPPLSPESPGPAGPSRGHRFPTATATPLTGISIDGRLDDWPKSLTRHSIENKLRNSSAYDRSERGVASDPDAYFMVGYQPEAGLVYLAVVVDDDDLVAGFKDPWHTDAVEVYIDGLYSDRSIPVAAGEWPNHLEAATMPVLQYVAVPGRGAAFADPRGRNPSLVYGNIGETITTMSYRREGHTTTYEWAIQAFDRFPGQPTRFRAGQSLGFDVAVVDKDRDKALPAWFSWGPAPKPFKGIDAGNIGELILGTAR